MNIVIAGCGNAGSAVAADLSLKGNNVTLLKTSNTIHNEHFKVIASSQKIVLEENDATFISSVKVTDNFAEAIKNKDLIIIFIQTNYHEDLIKKLSEYVEDGQTVLIEPGYLSTCYFLKYCKKNITVVEAESSPIDCRIIHPGKVKVLFRNVCNPVGVYPSNNTEKTKELLDSLGYNFEYSQSVVTAALHNPNLIVHTVGAIMSIPRIEYATKINVEYSMYKEVFMPHVWTLVLALDEEKINVLKKLGYPGVPYVEACKHRNSLDCSRDATEVFFDYANNSAPSGPNIPDSRYVTEDVSQGLVMLESLGQVFKVSTPVCTALIDIASAMLKREFRSEGRTVNRLGAEQIKMLFGEVKI